MRLDRFLHDMGFGTRSDIEKLLRAGAVMLEGERVKKGNLKVSESSQISVDGVKIAYEPYVYLMLYKPADVISATTDAHDETVLDLLPERYAHMNAAPIGRLDKDTTGLLLITNDGNLSHRLTSPKHHVAKTYIVSYDGVLCEDAVLRCSEGIDLGDFTTAPAKLELGEDGECMLTIREGKFHQVKRMIHALGGEVTALHRERFGGLALDDMLAPGEWRKLTAEELKILSQAPEKLE